MHSEIEALKRIANADGVPNQKEIVSGPYYLSCHVNIDDLFELYSSYYIQCQDTLLTSDPLQAWRDDSSRGYMWAADYNNTRAILDKNLLEDAGGGLYTIARSKLLNTGISRVLYFYPVTLRSRQIIDNIAWWNALLYANPKEA